MKIHLLLYVALWSAHAFAMNSQWIKVDRERPDIEIVKDLYRHQDGYEELNMQAKDPISNTSFRELEQKFKYYIIGVTKSKNDAGKYQHTYYDGFNLVFNLLENSDNPVDPVTKQPIEEIIFFHYKKYEKDEYSSGEYKKYDRFERFICLPRGPNKEDDWELVLRRAFGQKGFGHFNAVCFDCTNGKSCKLTEKAYTVTDLDNFATFTFEELCQKAKMGIHVNGTEAPEEYKKNINQRALDAAVSTYMIGCILEGQGQVELALYWYSNIDGKNQKTGYKEAADKRIQEIEKAASQDNSLPWYILQGIETRQKDTVLGENCRIVDRQLQFNGSTPIDFNTSRVFVDAIKEAEEQGLPYFLMVAKTTMIVERAQNPKDNKVRHFYHFYDMKRALPEFMYTKRLNEDEVFQRVNDMMLYNSKLSSVSSPLKEDYKPKVYLISLNFYVKPATENNFYSFSVSSEYIPVQLYKEFKSFQNYAEKKAEFVVQQTGEWAWNTALYGQKDLAQVRVAEFLQKFKNYSGAQAFIDDTARLFKEGKIEQNKKEAVEKIFKQVTKEQEQHKELVKDHGNLLDSMSALVRGLQGVKHALGGK